LAEDTKGRDWLAVGISLFSLGISVLTAGYTIFYHHDEVRVVIGQAMLVTRDKSDFSLSEQQEFTFINSGNRQALISEIYGELVLAVEGSVQCSGPAKSILINAFPVVLKPGDIQVVHGKIAAAYPWKKVGDSMRFHEDGNVEGAARYLVCLRLYVTTPDNSSETWVQPLYDIPASSSTGEDRELFDKHEALRVLQRTHLGL
jgi:filamentous hemagglutinin family protein